MGAKVQCGNYFPGYYSMKDLNEDAKGGSWLQFHEDEMLKRGQYYNNGLTLRPTDGCSEYDKETLKQTMLKHEAIFKKQVYELHRLYRIQKDLMDDLKKKELSKYSFPVEMAQLSPFSFQMESEGIQNSWQACGLPVARSNVCTKPSISVADRIQSPSKFAEEGSLRVGSFPSQNGVNDYELLNSKVKKFPRKMFDLQLPADEYIDSEESELIEDEKIPENDVKLTLGTGSVNGLEGDGGKANSPSQNSPFVPRLGDLNESNQGICIKEATSSSLVNFPNSLSSHEEGGGAQLSWKLNTHCLGPSMDFFLKNQKDRDHKTCMNILHAEHEGSKRGRLPFNLEAAGERKSDGDSFTQGFGRDRGTASSEPMQIGLKKTCNLPSFLLSDQRQTEVRFGENPDCVVEISKTIPGPTKSNYEGPLVPPLSVSFQIFSEIDDARIRTPLVSSLRKSSLNQSPLVVQALPCYKGSGGINKPRHTNSSTQNPDISGDEWYLNSNLRSNPSFKTEVLYQDGFIHGIKSESNSPSMQVPIVSLDHLNLNKNCTSGHEHFEDLHPRNFLEGLDCKGVKSAKHMQAPTVTSDHLNLNNSNTSGHKQFEDLHPRSFFKGLDCKDVKCAKNMSLTLELSNSNGFGDQGGLRGDRMLVDGEGRLGHLSELRKEMFNECMNYKHDTQMGSGFSQDYLQVIPSRDAEIQGFQIQFKRESGPSLGFMQNSQSLPSKTVEVQKNGLSDVTKDGTILVKPRFSKEHSDFISASNSTNSVQDNFKINDFEKNMKIGLHKGDCSGDLKPPNLARQLSLDLNIETAKSFTDQQQVQLEISSKDEADFPSPGKDHSPVANSKNTSLPEKIPAGGPVKLLLCDQSPDEDTVTSTAAETIVAMSLVACEQSNIVTCRPLMTDLRDCLDWFAEVVVSNGDDIESVEGDSDGDFECSDDGLDFFELMTLRLSETKIDEFLCKTRTQDEDEKGGGSALHGQSSRGRFWRRRQRRDFQKEILPGIASLSRYEVTEDLQTIGGLMRASGCSWPPGLTRRGVGGNDWHFTARGRRRARFGSTAWTGNLVVSPALQEASNGEPDPECRSLKGIQWGKTTRRRRMQRFPAGTSYTPLI